MTYEFPTDIQERLNARLNGDGVYQSEDDVIRDAMDALDQIEQDKLARWNERNRLATVQSNRGLSKPLDDETVLARLRDRLAKEGILESKTQAVARVLSATSRWNRSNASGRRRP